MLFLFRLLAELLRPLLRLLRGGADAEAEVYVAPPAPEPFARPGPPPPTAEEAIARRRAREPVPPVATVTPLRAEPGEDDHVDREATVVDSFGPEDEVGATLDVAEPWDGYDGMPAGVVVQRVRGADEATKGVVRLYESTHKKRRTVLAATGA